MIHSEVRVLWKSGEVGPAQAGQTEEAGLDKVNTAKKKRPSCHADERWTNTSWERMGCPRDDTNSAAWNQKHCIPRDWPDSEPSVRLQKTPEGKGRDVCSNLQSADSPSSHLRGAKNISHKKYPNSLSLESVSLVKWSPKEWSLWALSLCLDQRFWIHPECQWIW